MEKQDEREEEVEICDVCGGRGTIYIPAENVGGNLYGPDDRPCPECQYKEPEDRYEQFDEEDDGDDDFGVAL